MSLQHRPLRSSLTTLAITGAAALAAVLAGAPAMADGATVTDPIDTTQTPGDQTPEDQAAPDEVAPAEVPPADPTDAEVPDEVAESIVPEAEPGAAAGATGESAATGANARDKRLTAAAEAAEEDVVADFGYRKFRVGVQVADGSFVPEGGTVGSTFRITITGGDISPRPEECTKTTTFLGGGANPSGYSVCDPDESSESSESSDEGSEFARSVTIEDTDPTGPYLYRLEPGETATIVQTKAADGLEMSPDTVVLGPCTDDPQPGCAEPSFPFGDAADVLFENEGTPPTAADDSAVTDEGEAVDVDVLANDDTSVAPITGLEVDDDPSNGTVVLDDDGAARYTPDAEFSGEDTFTYALSTQNGTDTATVTVQVEAEAEAIAPVADETDEPRAAADVSSALPNTGGPDLSLLGYGALLLTGGGWLTLRSRRRVVAADRG